MAVEDGAVVADLYLRLSDFRADGEGSFPAREAALRTEARRLGWAVHRVVVENDVDEVTGKRKPATAWKRQLVRDKNGKPLLAYGRRVYRVLRDGWQSVLEDLGSGAANAVLAEDLDRVARDPRDIEDLIDAVSACGGNARSVSGSLTLTDGGRSDELAMARVMTAMSAKASADTSRRVKDARARYAGQSFGGGRRPYGFAVDEASEQYHRRLVVVPAEAAVIRRAAADLLNRVSLKSVARDLRDRGVATVTGAQWSAETLRDILLNDAVTGLTDDRGVVVWPGIIERDEQDRLRDLFASDSREVTGRDGKTYMVARNTSANGNAPRWLLSLIARCGVCGLAVKAQGGAGRRAYCCPDGHTRRNAAAVDAYISRRVVERLSAPDVADLLRPPPRPGTDTPRLRAEQRTLTRKRDDLARLLMAEVLTEAGVRKERTRIDQRLAAIGALLAASDQPDQLADFRGQPAAAVWEAMPLPRRREVVKVLMDVTILPAGRTGNKFSEDTVRVEWKTA